LKALVFHGIEDLRIEEMEVPEIGDFEALLKVRAAAICGSDIRVKASGHKSIPEGSTRILGHEMAGEVVKVGPKVKNLKPGDRIALAPVAGCGYCRQCLKGSATLCSSNTVMGHSINGSFAEYAKIPENYVLGGNCFILPDGFPFEVAALAEPLATVFSSLEMCSLKPSDIILIIGAGPIGLMHVVLSKMFGAQKIILSEVSEQRRDMARAFGADVIIDPVKDDLRKIVYDESFGRGADVVIIAAGSPKAQEESLELAATGGVINFFGTIPKGQEKIAIDSNLIHYRNLKVLGMTGTSVLNFFRTMELLASGKINIENFISGKFALEDFKQAFEHAKLASSLKVLFIMD
jgi:L-iditol 2-dehydrogenase